MNNDTNIKTSLDFGKAIKNARKKQKLTQMQLAWMSGVGRRFIVDLEKGKPTCSLDKSLHVLNILGVELITK